MATFCEGEGSPFVCFDGGKNRTATVLKTTLSEGITLLILGAKIISKIF